MYVWRIMDAKERIQDIGGLCNVSSNEGGRGGSSNLIVELDE